MEKSFAFRKWWTQITFFSTFLIINLSVSNFPFLVFLLSQPWFPKQIYVSITHIFLESDHLDFQNSWLILALGIGLFRDYFVSSNIFMP